MSSEMQYSWFPNMGIFRNMKPTYVSWYSIPGKTYGLRDVDTKTRKCSVMSLCLNKDMSKFHVFINIFFQKYDPKQKFLY